MYAYVLQDDQRAIDTADGVVAQARLHGHHPRVYLVCNHGGCIVTACDLGVEWRGAEVGGVVLLYYRRVRVASSVRPGGGARWIWEDVGDAAAVGELDCPEMELDRAYDVKATQHSSRQAARLHLSRHPRVFHVLPDVCTLDYFEVHVSLAFVQYVAADA